MSIFFLSLSSSSPLLHLSLRSANLLPSFYFHLVSSHLPLSSSLPLPLPIPYIPLLPHTSPLHILSSSFLAVSIFGIGCLCSFPSPPPPRFFLRSVALRFGLAFAFVLHLLSLLVGPASALPLPQSHSDPSHSRSLGLTSIRCKQASLFNRHSEPPSTPISPPSPSSPSFRSPWRSTALPPPASSAQRRGAPYGSG
jgi:hypothetical protein